MKKIIALILAMIMVVFAVAACGDNAGTTPTTTPTPTDPTTEGTKATTTEEPVVIPDPYTAVCMYTAGANPVAVNAATGEVVGALTAGEGVELIGGNLYIVDVVPAEGKATATKLLGAAVVTKNTTGGWTNTNSKGALALKDSSYFMKAQSLKNFQFNCYMDTALLNTGLAEANLGKFGTMAINFVDGDLTTALMDGEDELALTDAKWRFVYVSYDGSSLAAATGKEFTGSVMNARDLMYTAIDKAYGAEIGTLRATWVKAMEVYGGLPSVRTLDGKYNGTTEQNYWTGKWANELIPVKYAGALTSYNGLKAEGADTVDEAAIAAALVAADAALATANTNLANAVAAKAEVKALYDAMVAADEAYKAQRQVEYDVYFAYETEKAKNKDSQATADAKAVWVVEANKVFATDKVSAGKREGDGPMKVAYNEAKAAYDAAILADADLAALNQALTEATTAQKTAKSNQDKVDNYKLYAELNEKFIAAYNELCNVALWDTADMDNSALVKMYGDVEEGDKEMNALPTFTYYYDNATETYTVFVTSMKTSLMLEKFSTGNQPLT